MRSLADWQRRDQQRIRATIDLQAENPRPPNCVAVQEEAGVYRVRVEDDRIVAVEPLSQALAAAASRPVE